MTLADFLLARIDEDADRVDSIPDWYCTDSARGEGWGSRGDCPLCDKYMFDGDESATEDAYWEHYEEVHQRTRLLAECKAKRQIVSLYDVQFGVDFDGEPLDQPIGGEGAETYYDVLRLLALTYADHPDYRESWRP